MARLTAEERESYWYGTVGCELCPCGQNPDCTTLTITRLIQRYRVTSRTADRPRSGRPHVTTANEDRQLTILHLHSRFLTVTSSAATGLGHVISCRLRRHGIGVYRPFREMILTSQHRLRRFRWARQLQRWQHRKWQRVHLSDERRFQLFRADGRTRIY